MPQNLAKWKDYVGFPTEYVDEGDVHDGLELPEEHVGDHGAEDRGDVAGHPEHVINHLKIPKNVKKKKNPTIFP